MIGYAFVVWRISWPAQAAAAAARCADTPPDASIEAGASIQQGSSEPKRSPEASTDEAEPLLTASRVTVPSRIVVQRGAAAVLAVAVLVVAIVLRFGLVRLADTSVSLPPAPVCYPPPSIAGGTTCTSAVASSSCSVSKSCISLVPCHHHDMLLTHTGALRRWGRHWDAAVLGCGGVGGQCDLPRSVARSVHVENVHVENAKY
jgi:hypothetical protein